MDKYEIVTGWYNASGIWCEGSNKYKTFEELFEGYKKLRDTVKIRRICLTNEYVNSIMNKREEQIKKDIAEMEDKFREQNVFICQIY